MGDQLVDRLVGMAGDRDPDRDTDRADAETAELECPDGGPHALADVESDLRRRVAQQDDEFLAAVASGDVLAFDVLLARAGDETQIEGFEARRARLAAAFTLPTPVYNTWAPAPSSRPRDSCGNAMTTNGFFIWDVGIGFAGRGCSSMVEL